MKLKICGMKFYDNILQTAALLPDYLGLIFYEKSSRYFDGILPELPKSVQKTGVFVDENYTNIVQKIDQYHLQCVQLHGKESPELCQKLQDHALVIKVFSIGNTFDFNILIPYEKSCDFYLFDTKGPLKGGNGVPFDWSVLGQNPSKKPYFLSGGISINDLGEIKKLAFPTLYGVDINSRFEQEPGLKNIELLREFKSKLYQEL